MKMKRNGLTAAFMLLTGALMTPVHAAETDTQSFKVKLTVTSSCDIHSVDATDVDFGSHKSTEASVMGEGGLSVNCTNGTPYDIGLDDGVNAVNSIRHMKSAGGETVAYTLWRDAARTQTWGNTVNSNTLAGVGTGAVQAITVYGKSDLASQNLKAGSYEDDVTATVTY